MQNLNQSILLSLPVSLPPFEEQQRTVAKVDELMAVCNELEVALASTQRARRQLFDAVLHEALNQIA